jgi:hypothetical protein
LAERFKLFFSERIKMFKIFDRRRVLNGSSVEFNCL